MKGILTIVPRGKQSRNFALWDEGDNQYSEANPKSTVTVVDNFPREEHVKGLFDEAKGLADIIHMGFMTAIFEVYTARPGVAYDGSWDEGLGFGEGTIGFGFGGHRRLHNGIGLASTSNTIDIGRLPIHQGKLGYNVW